MITAEIKESQKPKLKKNNSSYNCAFLYHKRIRLRVSKLSHVGLTLS